MAERAQLNVSIDAEVVAHLRELSGWLRPVCTMAELVELVLRAHVDEVADGLALKLPARPARLSGEGNP
ncbi:MAG: hypothetical protein ABMA25_00665 [Ilumatobacteraceae bacterium]